MRLGRADETSWFSLASFLSFLSHCTLSTSKGGCALTQPSSSTLTPIWVRRGRESGCTPQVENVAPRVVATFSEPPHVPGTVSPQAQVCIHSHRLFVRKFLGIHSYLPSYRGPGRALRGSPWAPVLEGAVCVGRRPRLGGDPPHVLSSEGNDCSYLCESVGTAGLGDGQVGDRGNMSVLLDYLGKASTPAFHRLCAQQARVLPRMGLVGSGLLGVCNFLLSPPLA